jgi:hypothetical protein
MSYDTWKSTNRDDEQLGRSTGAPVAYRCRDCAWQGKGITAASEHFWQTEHTLLHADDPRFAARDAQMRKQSA